MRIDATQGFGPRPPDDASAHMGNAKPATGSVADEQAVVVERQQQPLVTQAMAFDEVNTQAVNEARKLLDSGELDGPEAAGRLAKALLDRGL